MTNNQQNLSSRNAFARFMLGSVMTAYGTLHLIRDPKNRRGQMLILFGAMKTAEGATKFCPAKAMGMTMSCSNMLQKMMSGNNPQNTFANTGAEMNNGTQSSKSTSGGSTGQMGESIMQKVGNLAQNLAEENATQNSAGSNTNQTVGTNNSENQATTPSGSSNKNTNTSGNTNTKNTVNSENKKPTSASNNNNNNNNNNGNKHGNTNN